MKLNSITKVLLGIALLLISRETLLEYLGYTIFAKLIIDLVVDLILLSIMLIGLNFMKNHSKNKGIRNYCQWIWLILVDKKNLKYTFGLIFASIMPKFAESYSYYLESRGYVVPSVYNITVLEWILWFSIMFFTFCAIGICRNSIK